MTHKTLLKHHDDFGRILGLDHHRIFFLLLIQSLPLHLTDAGVGVLLIRSHDLSSLTMCLHLAGIIIWLLFSLDLQVIQSYQLLSLLFDCLIASELLFDDEIIYCMYHSFVHIFYSFIL